MIGKYSNQNFNEFNVEEKIKRNQDHFENLSLQKSWENKAANVNGKPGRGKKMVKW